MPVVDERSIPFVPLQRDRRSTRDPRGKDGRRAGGALKGTDRLRRDHRRLVDGERARTAQGGKARTSVVLPEGVAALEPRAGLLFRRQEGGAWTKQTVNRRWVVARRDVGLPKVRFHDLRHFHATLLLDRGASCMDVAIQLGHTDNGELVRRTYGHPDSAPALERIASL